MKALFRNRILLSGRGMDFATSKLDLLARKSRRNEEILKNYELAMGWTQFLECASQWFCCLQSSVATKGIKNKSTVVSTCLCEACVLAFSSHWHGQTVKVK